MKYKILLPVLFLLGFFNSSVCQQTVTLQHDGLQRSYIIYVPSSYDGNSSIPLLLAFHGFTSNALVLMGYSGFNVIAEQNNFIVVYPQGSNFNGSSHWNVGGWTLGSTVNDVSFTEALLDKISSEYNIDQKRVYSTGMSNGGYMSFLLACQLSDRIAAIASITGSMTPQTYDACNPSHPTPILQMHGTADGVVPYQGNILWTRSIIDVLSFWYNYNHCNTDASLITIANTNTTDGSSVEHYKYAEGDNCISVEHYKVLGGDHDWPGAWGNMDINASNIVWDFFSHYDINGLIGCGNLASTDDLTDLDIEVYPNPTSSFINIKLKHTNNLTYQLLTTDGQYIASGKVDNDFFQINLLGMNEGIYILNIGNQFHKILKIN